MWSGNDALSRRRLDDFCGRAEDHVENEICKRLREIIEGPRKRERRSCFRRMRLPGFDEVLAGGPCGSRIVENEIAELRRPAGQGSSRQDL